MVSLAPNVRANSSAETTAFFEYSEKSVGAMICRNCIAPPPFSVVLYNRSCCSLCEISVADGSCDPRNTLPQSTLKKERCHSKCSVSTLLLPALLVSHSRGKRLDPSC